MAVLAQGQRCYARDVLEVDERDARLGTVGQREPLDTRPLAGGEHPLAHLLLVGVQVGVDVGHRVGSRQRRRPAIWVPR